MTLPKRDAKGASRSASFATGSAPTPLPSATKRTSPRPVPLKPLNSIMQQLKILKQKRFARLELVKANLHASALELILRGHLQEPLQASLAEAFAPALDARGLNFSLKNLIKEKFPKLAKHTAFKYVPRFDFGFPSKFKRLSCT